MRPEISIVMPCFNRARFLERVLPAYDRQQGSAPFEIVAVDDASSDATPAVLRSHRSDRYHLRPLVLANNAGPAHARNQGIAQAEGPLVLFVGDDILPADDFVEQHLAAHREHPQAERAILGKTVWPADLPQNTLMRHIDGAGGQQFGYHRMRHGQELDFRHFYTSNISLKRSLLERVRPWFDTGFRYAAYEDVELAYRLQERLGMRIFYTERPLAYHYHYYSVWNFAVRQYRCGLMSAVLVGKHARLRRRWRFHRLKIFRLAAALPGLRGLVGEPQGREVDRLEELALHLASFYELTPMPPLDWLYLPLLEYFVLKGMIDAEMPPAAALPARRALLALGLAPHLMKLIDLIKAQGLPYPPDVCLSLVDLARRCEQAGSGRGRAWTAPLRHAVRRVLVPNYA